MILIFAFITFSAFADVKTVVTGFMEKHKIKELSLTVKNLRGETCFALNLGMPADKPIPVASAGKWVTSSVILRLVARKKITLEETTGKILGWAGPKGKIRLRDLLNMTSGLVPKHPCLYEPKLSLESCVDKIYHDTTPFKHNTFYYGESSHQVAARMVEVVTGKSWNELVKEEFTEPLNLKSHPTYYAVPLKLEKGQPLIGAGLVLSTADYERFLLKIALEKNDYLPEELMREQYAPSQPISRESKELSDYGLGLWRECTPNKCPARPILSSLGAYGFYPWLDRERGLLGILSLAEGPEFWSHIFPLIYTIRPEILRITESCRARK